MKFNIPHIKVFILFIGILFFSSCQSDGDTPDEMNMPEEDHTISEVAITNNDPIINDILKITTINGSRDDVLDGLPQAKVILPVAISVNGQSFEVENRKGLNIAKAVVAYSTEDDDKVSFEYPIDMRFNDFTIRTIDNEEAFIAAKNEFENKPNYNGINGGSLIYPISFAFFNTVSRERGTVVVRNNQDMSKLLLNLLDSDMLEINYPISIRSEFEDITINIADNDRLSAEIMKINDEYQTRQVAEPNGKVLVCHNVSNNPKDRDVNISALAAHLRHGDIIGGCLSSDR